MAITQKYSTNAAVQYNETLADYLIADNSTGKKFLTEAPLNRLIRSNELSALYFLIDDASFTGATILKFKDEAGNLIGEEITNLTSTYNIHNGVLIGFENVPYYVPANTKKICAVISSAVNLFSNADFALGTGNLFTDWTLTQPTRTNLTIRSQEFDNAAWTKYSSTITANSTLAPDNTLTADSLTETATTATHAITPTSTIATTIGATYTFSISLKKGLRSYALLFFANSSKGCYFDLNNGLVLASVGSIVSAKIIPEDNGFYRCVVVATASLASEACQIYASANGTSASYAGSTASPALYLWGHQMETGSFATPYIPTTSASVTTSLGEFLQDPTGGVDGGRALKMWVDTSGVTTFLRQAVPLTIANNYRIRFRARVDEADNGFVTIYSESVAVNSTEWTWYSVSFTAPASASTFIDFDYVNDSNYGWLYLDKVSISLTSQTSVTEERCFILDERCFANENQIQWINKLGGVDTWTFTGNPIEAVQVDRESLIEYQMQNNYQAPNEIYAYRSIKSFETMTLFHRCENEETAVWLRSELLNSIAMYLKVGADFHPIIPIGSSIETKNFAQRNTNVRFNFRFAYDINIQKR